MLKTQIRINSVNNCPLNHIDTINDQNNRSMKHVGKMYMSKNSKRIRQKFLLNSYQFKFEKLIK